MIFLRYLTEIYHSGTIEASGLKSQHGGVPSEGGRVEEIFAFEVQRRGYVVVVELPSTQALREGVVKLSRKLTDSIEANV